MMVNSWGGILDISVVPLDIGAVCTVGTMVGARFGDGVYSVSWGE